MMFTIFAEKGLFEKVITSPQKYPKWNRILKSHSRIFLNSGQNEIDDDLTSIESPLFGFFNSLGGNIPKIEGYPNFFNNIYQDIESISSEPRAAFFLNFSKEETEEIQRKYGIVVQSNQCIEDGLLDSRLLYGFYKGKKVPENQGGLKSGWEYVLENSNMPPFNAMIISDNYLFSNKDNVKGELVNRGVSNLTKLLSGILPTELETTFHLIVRSSDPKSDNNWQKSIFQDINKEIKKLRSYPFVFELIFLKHEDLHDRHILANYAFAYSGFGYAIFNGRDNQTVCSTTTIDFSGYFNSVESIKTGQTVFQISNDQLSYSKRLWSNLHNLGGTYYCNIPNPDSKLINRLINDV